MINGGNLVVAWVLEGTSTFRRNVILLSNSAHAKYPYPLEARFVLKTLWDTYRSSARLLCGSPRRAFGPGSDRRPRDPHRCCSRSVKRASRCTKLALFEQANDTLAKAYLIRPLPSIGLWQARVLAKLNHQVDAFERLRDVTHLTLTAGDPASEKKAQVDASAEMMTLSRQLPVLTIQVKGTVGSDVTLSLDGKPLDRSLIGQPHRVNPGSHHIEAVRLSDRVSSQSDVEVKIGERSTVVLQFVGNASGSGQLLTPEPNSTQAASPGINAGQPLTPSSAAMPLSSNPVLATSGSGQTPPVHAAPKTLGNSATASLLATNAQPSTQATGQRHATVRPLAMTGGLLPVTIEPDPRQMAPALEATSKRSTANSLVGYGSLGTGNSVIGGWRRCLCFGARREKCAQ